MRVMYSVLSFTRGNVPKLHALQGFLQLLRTYKLSQEMPAYQVHALQHGTYQAIEL